MYYRISAANLALLAAGSLLLSSPRQNLPPETMNRIDAVIAAAYQTAASGFPCKVKTRGKPRFLRWEDVDRCLNGAAGKVDWEKLSAEVAELHRVMTGVSSSETMTAVAASLEAHALTFAKVLAVEKPETLLPLTNSLLKFLPEKSLHGLPVTDRVGNKVGTFLGTYTYERTGGLSTANMYRLVLFQYTDPKGNVQTSGDKLLLDSFGVPWGDAAPQAGFMLPLDKITPPR